MLDACLGNYDRSYSLHLTEAGEIFPMYLTGARIFAVGAYFLILQGLMHTAQ